MSLTALPEPFNGSSVEQEVSAVTKKYPDGTIRRVLRSPEGIVAKVWRFRYIGLTDDEALDLQAFHAEHAGAATEAAAVFDFTDPLTETTKQGLFIEEGDKLSTTLDDNCSSSMTVTFIEVPA